VEIVVIGTGYVGLVTGTCFAESGNHVTCIDIDENKIQMLKSGEIPTYEPGLKEMVKRNINAQRLGFTTNYEESVPHSKCVFIAVGTSRNGTLLSKVFSTPISRNINVDCRGRNLVTVWLARPLHLYKT